MMGMSVFLGYYAFDLQGILYGPLLLCVINIVYEVFMEVTVKLKGNGQMKVTNK